MQNQEQTPFKSEESRINRKENAQKIRYATTKGKILDFLFGVGAGIGLYILLYFVLSLFWGDELRLINGGSFFQRFFFILMILAILIYKLPVLKGRVYLLGGFFITIASVPFCWFMLLIVILFRALFP